MGGLAILLGIGLVLAWIASVAMLAWFLTHPPRRTYSSAVARGLAGDPSEMDPPAAFETWTVRAHPRDIEVWDIAADDPVGPTLVLVHGWSDSRIGALVRASHLRRSCSRIIAFDLPGHGVSHGVCHLGATEHALVRMILDALQDEPRPVVLFGWSLGAGVALRVAADDDATHPRVAGVIAEAPYIQAKTPARRVLHLRRLPHRLSLPPALALLGTRFGIGPRWRGFDRVQIAARVRVPLLVLHGSADPISPIEDGRAIAQAAPHARLAEIPDASHNDLWTEHPFAERCTAEACAFLAPIRGPSA